MRQLISFVLGALTGGLSVFAGALWFFTRTSPEFSEAEELSIRLESIPIEEICKSVTSGVEIQGEDHVTVWNDGIRYIVAGWRVGKNGIPYWSWTGADLPRDVPECGKP
jgi:hypothetical protein